MPKSNEPFPWDASNRAAQLQQQLKEAAENLAPSASHCRIEPWFNLLGITLYQQKVLGRVWSFQYKNSEKEVSEKSYYRMSHARAAREMNDDPDNWRKALYALTAKGILKRGATNQRTPATYQVDLSRCWELVQENQKLKEDARAENVERGRARHQAWIDKKNSESDFED